MEAHPLRIIALVLASAALALTPAAQACDPPTIEPERTLDLGAIGTFYVHQGQIYQESNGIKGFQWCDPRLDRVCCGPEDARIF